MAHPGQRKEAITSRPWLMSSIGRKTEHAGQTTITIYAIHAFADKAEKALTRVSIRDIVNSCGWGWLKGGFPGKVLLPHIAETKENHREETYTPSRVPVHPADVVGVGRYPT
jgi:hypothetical protein